MSRVSRIYPLPSPRRPLQRVRCSNCGRTWGVYEGTIPRLWTLVDDRLFCDTHGCNAEMERHRAERQPAQRLAPARTA